MSCPHEIGGAPPSAIQRLIAATLRALLKPLLMPAFTVRAPLSLQRRWLKAVSSITLPARGVVRFNAQIESVPVEWVGNGQALTLLYLHGGGYVSGSPGTHRALTTHLAKRLNATVAVPDYRLAPEYPFPAALNDAVAVYRGLVAQGHDLRRLAIAGDSAGAGLALALLQHLGDDATLPAPLAGVLLSPWLDLSLEHTPQQVKGELMLNTAWLHTAAQAYAGDHRARPEVSPLAGNLNGLPPLLIQCGSDEILRGDSERLAAALADSDTRARYQLYPQRWHVFQLHAGVLKDADWAIDAIADFLTRKQN
ncbi:alpha/beta hydrolase [uncultured Salinisphaera sp.]|uniref:alpha/beta hydrolase n=1 Tax=uncultured Salinisphaera sp. TaxID=359372 RepID=UPI0032B1F15E